jgi:hypothetical protein
MIIKAFIKHIISKNRTCFNNLAIYCKSQTIYLAKIIHKLLLCLQQIAACSSIYTAGCSLHQNIERHTQLDILTDVHILTLTVKQNGLDSSGRSP